MEDEEIVVDASVVVKWFLAEEDSEKALKLRDDHVSHKVILSAPTLMIYEVLNALKYSKVYSGEELSLIAKSLNGYGFKLYQLEGNLKERTIKTAAKHDLTIYDASYIALAEHLNTKLYTADNELAEKVPENVATIEEYPT